MMRIASVVSPVQVKGVDSAFAGKPTTIMVFEHDGTEIGQAEVTQASGIGKTNIATSITSSSSFKGETQEDIIALLTYIHGKSCYCRAVLVNVLLSA